MWSLATNQKQVVAKHDAAVRYALHVKDMSNMLVTGSWDRTVRYWDLRQPNPVHTQQMPERVYAMDIKYPMMAVGMAARRIQVRFPQTTSTHWNAAADLNNKSKSFPEMAPICC